MLSSLLLSIAYVLTVQGHYGESEKLLHLAKTNDIHNYLRLINNYALNNKVTAEVYGNRLLESFTFNELPRRQRMLAEQTLYELNHWQEAGSLDDIVRDMKRSTNQLERGRSGKDIQQIQTDIVAKLDKLIKQEEDRQNKNSQKVEVSASPSNSPAPDSRVMGGIISKGIVDEKKLLQIAESWGTLPPNQRTKIVEEITRELPPKYKMQIEEYFKRLNKINK